jgi:hypothetical protein
MMRCTTRIGSWLALAALAALPSARAAAADAPATLDDIPASILRAQLLQLPVEARDRALAKLGRFRGSWHDAGSLRVDVDGRVAYACLFGHAAPKAVEAVLPESAPPSVKGSSPAARAVSKALDIPVFHSRASAHYTLYIDFDGDAVYKAYDEDGDDTSFDAVERAMIEDVWRRVAEDFAPFDIDVTTEEPAIRTNAGRAIVTQVDLKTGGQATGSAYIGYSYLDVFPSWEGSWIYPENMYDTDRAIRIAMTVAHEFGHQLGLEHDGDPADEYYYGHGSWCPIMGGSMGREVDQWSKGEYTGATNAEDDVALIAQVLGGTTIPDDAGDVCGEARTISGNSDITGDGIIHDRTDVDVWRIEAGSGVLDVTVHGAFAYGGSYLGGDINFRLRLLDEFGAELAVANPATAHATLTRTVSEGVYYLEIDGIGAGDPMDDPPTGYTDYGCVGSYTIEGTRIPRDYPPIIREGETASVTMSEDGYPTAFSLVLRADDGNNDVLTWSLASPPSHGTAGVSGTGISKTITYVPEAEYSGSDSFVVRVEDTDANADEILVNVTIVAVNDPPAALGEAYATDEDVELVVPSPGVLANDDDVEGDALTAVAWSAPLHGAVSIDSDGSFVYTPDADFNGLDSFGYRAYDGHVASAVVTVTIDVAAVNDDPLARDDAGVTVASTAIGLDVLDNDEDVDGDALHVSAVVQPSNGAAAINADDTVQYTPDVAFVGEDAFTYTAADGNGGTAMGVATVTVYADADGDGLGDAWEVLYFADLSSTANGDDDDDGLTNAVEFSVGTDPTKDDTDGDGLKDGYEIGVSDTDPLDSDTDADGMADGWEVSNDLDPLSGADASLDPDGDGASNLEEFIRNTNPNEFDGSGADDSPVSCAAHGGRGGPSAMALAFAMVFAWGSVCRALVRAKCG